MTAQDRLVRLRETLQSQLVDALLVVKSANVDYITGLDGIHDDEDPHVALVTATEAILFTDSRYDEVARGGAQGTEWDVRTVKGRMVDLLVDTIADTGIERIAFEDSMTYGMYTEWEKSLEAVAVVPAKEWIERLRWIKDDAEIERIGAAQAITDEAFTAILGFIKPGVTEREIALELEYTLLKLGADGLAFPSIVASGPNGSMPHAHPGSRVIEKGDLVTLDFGAAYKGYRSDMTRTVGVGPISEEQREIYATVLLAQMAGVEACIAGRTGVEIDAAARDIIVAGGYGEYFGHGTGHGVGLDIHEGPNASPRSTDVIPHGAVITIEPGIYLPGKCGVRIEDLVLVTEDGPINFTNSSKEFIEL